MSFDLLKPSEVPAMFYQNYSGFFTLSACCYRHSWSEWGRLNGALLKSNVRIRVEMMKVKTSKKKKKDGYVHLVPLSHYNWSQFRLLGGNKMAARWTSPLLAKLAITVHYRINWALKRCNNTSEGEVAQNCAPNSITGILQCFILSMRCTYLDMGSVTFT